MIDYRLAKSQLLFVYFFYFAFRYRIFSITVNFDVKILLTLGRVSVLWHPGQFERARVGAEPLFRHAVHELGPGGRHCRRQPTAYRRLVLAVTRVNICCRSQESATVQRYQHSGKGAETDNYCQRVGIYANGGD